MSTSNTPHPEVQIQPSAESIRRGHEVHDVNPRSILWLGAAVVGGVVVVQIFLWYLLMNMRTSEDGGDRHPPQLAKQIPPPPAPRLQSQSLRDYEEYRSEQESKLNSYSWIDREKGIVRVPISRAMDLATKRGLPVPAPANQPPGASPSSSENQPPTGASALPLIPAEKKPADKKGEP